MTTLHQSDLRPCLDCDASRRACRIALSAALLAALVACRAPSPRAAPPDRAPPPPATHEPGDASYDWHGLLIAPFGSVLKDIPLALHEVLLFRDDAHGSAAAGNAAAGNGATGNAAMSNRLSRIQASVRLEAARASDIFAAACAGWFKNAAPTPDVGTPGVGTSSVGTPGVGAPGTVPSSAEAQNAGVCEGRDGAIHFRGRLEEERGRADMPQAESVLSITLDSAPNP